MAQEGGETRSALRKAVAADPKEQAAFGEAWDAIATSRRRCVSCAGADVARGRGRASTQRLFSIAREHRPRPARRGRSPNTDRLPEFTHARLASLERQLYSPAPIYVEAEKVKLADSLAFMRERLGAGHALVRQVLDGEDARGRARPNSSTARRSTTLRCGRRSSSGGQAAVAGSTDPMILLARPWIPGVACGAEARSKTRWPASSATPTRRSRRPCSRRRGTSGLPDGTGRCACPTAGRAATSRTASPLRRSPSSTGSTRGRPQFAARPPFDVPQRWTIERRSWTCDALQLRLRPTTSSAATAARRW